MNIFDGLTLAAQSSVKGALTILLLFTSFGFIIGGRKGGLWVIRTAFEPIKQLFQRRITAIIYIAVFTIFSYYIGSSIKFPFK